MKSSLPTLNVLPPAPESMGDNGWPCCRVINRLFFVAGLIGVTACKTQHGTEPVDTTGIDTTASGAALDTVMLPLPSAPRLASKGNHSCVLQIDGQLVCWGNWGVGPTPPMLVPPPRDAEGAQVLFAAVTAGGGGNLCAISAEGEAYCITAFRQIYEPQDTTATHHDSLGSRPDVASERLSPATRSTVALLPTVWVSVGVTARMVDSATAGTARGTTRPCRSRLCHRCRWPRSR